MTKIKDCLPLVNGIWYYIDYQFPEIFDIDSSQLDVVFMSNWSMRTAAPILKLIHSDEATTMLTPLELVQLASVINGMYKHNWDKLMAVAEMEYDPIHNYHDLRKLSMEKRLIEQRAEVVLIAILGLIILVKLLQMLGRYRKVGI